MHGLKAVDELVLGGCQCVCVVSNGVVEVCDICDRLGVSVVELQVESGVLVLIADHHLEPEVSTLPHCHPSSCQLGPWERALAVGWRQGWKALEAREERHTTSNPIQILCNCINQVRFIYPGVPGGVEDVVVPPGYWVIVFDIRNRRPQISSNMRMTRSTETARRRSWHKRALAPILPVQRKPRSRNLLILDWTMPYCDSRKGPNKICRLF